MRFFRAFNPFKLSLFKNSEPNFVERGEDFAPVRDHTLKFPTVDRFSNYLPYTAYDETDRIFYLEGDQPGKIESIGFCIELTPQTGASREMAEFLTNLFTSGAPVGTGIQVSLMASPVVDPFFEAHLDATVKPDPSMSADQFRQARLLQEIAQRRVAFYRQGTRKPLFDDMNFMMRHYRGVLSVVMPAENHKDQRRVRDLLTMRESVIAILKSYGLFGKDWVPEDLINWCALILNPQNTMAGDFPTLNYEDDREIRQQIISRDTKIEEDEDHLEFNGGGYPPIAIRAMSVRSYPKYFQLPQMGQLIGHLRSYTISYTCPFVITFGAQITDFDGEKNRMLLKGARATQTAMSPMAKFLPDADDRKYDYDIANRAYEDGKGTVRIYHQLLLISPLDEVFEAEQAAKAVWRAEGIDIAVDRKVQKQALMGALPMLFGPLLQNDLKIFQRSSTKTVYNASNMLPVVAEWAGLGKLPLLTLFARRGQVMNLDIFANPSGNFNGVVVGTSGSGKSNFLIELAYRMIATGGRVWIIDVGRSYENLARILGGQFIEFKPESDICMNPFDMVQDLDEDMEILKPLLAQMIQPSAPLDDYRLSQIEINIRQLWAEFGPRMTMDQLSDRLMKSCYEGGSVEAFGMTPDKPINNEHCDPKIRELGVQLFPYTASGSYGKYFNGRSNVEFNSNLVVLELEELKGRKDLQSVVMLMLMYRITNEMYKGGRSNRYLVIIDEAWDLMGAGNASAFIEAGYRRARKYNGAFFTGTQGIGDYAKSETAKAALENADWLFLLRQKPESIEDLDKSGKLIMDEQTKSLLSSVTTMKGRFSEIFVRCADAPPSIGRLLFDPFSALMASTTASDFEAIQTLVRQGLSTEEAIHHLLKERGVHHA